MAKKIQFVLDTANVATISPEDKDTVLVPVVNRATVIDWLEWLVTDMAEEGRTDKRFVAIVNAVSFLRDERERRRRHKRKAPRRRGVRNDH